MSPFCLRRLYSAGNRRRTAFSATSGSAAVGPRSTDCDAGPAPAAASGVGGPLTGDQADYYFERAVSGSKYAAMKGFHVLRHSFASNLALRGVSPAVIKAFLGHETDEMHARYTHLFPEQKESAMGALWS